MARPSARAGAIFTDTDKERKTKMADYREIYANKLTTAEEAAGRVQDGWLIGMDAAVAAPPALVSAIAALAARG